MNATDYNVYNIIGADPEIWNGEWLLANIFL